jgi:hypothetical protein
MELNEEINRINQLMDINLINEGIDDIIKKLLGVSDESTQTILKGNSDELGQYSSSLKAIVGGSGKGTVSDIISFLSKEGLGSTDDAIATWIKSQPEIMNQIARNSDDIMKQASQIVFGKLKLANIFDQESIEAINELLTISLNKNRVDTIIKEIDDVLSTLRGLRGRGSNTNIEDLIKQFEDRKKLVQNYKSSMNASPMVKSTDNVVPTQFEGVVAKYYKNIDQEFSGPQLPEITQMITRLDNVTRNLDFDTSKIKLIGQKIQNNRLVYEFQHQDGPTFLMYKSTGSNVDSTGKEQGTWWALPGFANIVNYTTPEGKLVPRINGWFIKDDKSLGLVQGNNPFLTNMKQFLESNPNYKFNNEFNSPNKVISNTTENLLKGKRISNRSFVDSDIDWTNVSNSKNMNDYNKLIAQAIQTGDYQYISRSGFERFGIDNFRDHLMNNISTIHELDPSIGRWSVTFK